MFFSPQRLPVSWTSICIAILGVVYCAVQVAPLPVSLPCPGSGCRLAQDFTLFGLSLWWPGVIYFIVMALVCLRRAYGLALAFATMALIADAALLVLMLLTASCILCLGAGALIALLFFAIRRHASIKSVQEPGPSLVLILWSGFFIAALAFAATESMEPWHIAGPENAPRRIYFAPSCPACRDAVRVFADEAVFIPVVEKDSDKAAIYAMHKAILGGGTVVEALEAAVRATESDTLAEPPFLDSITLQLQLIGNKAQVLRLGFDALPLIMVKGMPQNLRPGTAHETTGAASPSGADAPSSNANGSPAALPPELVAPLDSCGDATQIPCDPPR